MEGHLFFRVMRKSEGIHTDVKVHDTFETCLGYKMHGSCNEIWGIKGISSVH